MKERAEPLPHSEMDHAALDGVQQIDMRENCRQRAFLRKSRLTRMTAAAHEKPLEGRRADASSDILSIAPAARKIFTLLIESIKVGLRH